MITVVSLRKVKGNFYKAAFSNGEELRISEDLLVRYRLLKGQELDEAEFNEIKKKIGYDMGLQMAMNYLSYQMHSEMEVRKYLKEKEIETADRNQIVETLKELDVVNDQNFGDSYIRTQVRLSDKGPGYLSQQLKKKGLAPEVIENALTFYPQKEQLAIALRSGEKFFKVQRNKSLRESQQKLRLQLMQKGFSKEIVNEVLSLLETEPDEESEYQALVSQGEKLWRRHQRLEPKKRNMKIKQSLYQKGFALDTIQIFLDEKEASDEENF
ncbi:recombination regulator RecX [Enterococcus sp. LJL90]